MCWSPTRWRTVRTAVRSTHAAQVAGLVLVDAFSPKIPKLLGPAWPAYDKLLAHPSGLASSPRAWLEVIDINRSVTELADAPALKARLPMAVVSKTEPFPLPTGIKGLNPSVVERIWNQTQKQLTALEPGHRSSLRPAVTTTYRYANQISSLPPPGWYSSEPRRCSVRPICLDFKAYFAVFEPGSDPPASYRSRPLLALIAGCQSANLGLGPRTTYDSQHPLRKGGCDEA